MTLLAVFSLGWYLEYRHQASLVRDLRRELTVATEQTAFYAAENEDLRYHLQQLATASDNLVREINGLAASHGVIVPPPGGLVA